MTDDKSTSEADAVGAASAQVEEPAPVLRERRGNVLLITLNRPAVRNAVDGALAAGVAGALDELDGDDGLTVGILTGAGGCFCAGMDLGAFVRGESPWFGDRGFAGIALNGLPARPRLRAGSSSPRDR